MIIFDYNKTWLINTFFNDSSKNQNNTRAREKFFNYIYLMKHDYKKYKPKQYKPYWWVYEKLKFGFIMFSID